VTPNACLRTADHIVRQEAEESPAVYLGVDSHKDSLAASIVDVAGREVKAHTFTNTPVGHRQLLRWALAGGVERFGIECSGTYGAALAKVLLAAGVDVREVPPKLSVRERRRGRRLGKSDPLDALAIARVTAREEKLPPVAKPAMCEELGVLCDYRDELVTRRSAIANRLHCDLSVICPGYTSTCRSLVSGAALTRVTYLLRGQHNARADVARRRVAELRRLDLEIKARTREISTLVRMTGTHVVEIKGVGPLLGARILAEVGDVRRYPTSSHFASANGTAPIPASSGKVVRYRLNRGGNRRLNRALHFVAIVQAHSDDRAKAYLARKISTGKSGKEAIRCLKRHLSDAVYRALQADFATPQALAA